MKRPDYRYALVRDGQQLAWGRRHQHLFRLRRVLGGVIVQRRG